MSKRKLPTITKPEIIKQFEEIGELYNETLDSSSNHDKYQEKLKKLREKIAEAKLNNIPENNWPNLIYQIHSYLKILGASEKFKELKNLENIAAQLQTQDILSTEELAQVQECKYGKECRNPSFLHQYLKAHPYKRHTNFAGALLDYLSNYKLPSSTRLARGNYKSRKKSRKKKGGSFLSRMMRSRSTLKPCENISTSEECYGSPNKCIWNKDYISAYKTSSTISKRPSKFFNFFESPCIGIETILDDSAQIVAKSIATLKRKKRSERAKRAAAWNEAGDDMDSEDKERALRKQWRREGEKEGATGSRAEELGREKYRTSLRALITNMTGGGRKSKKRKSKKARKSRRRNHK